MHAHASPRERNRDSSGSDAELERCTVACERGEELDRQDEDLRKLNTPAVVKRAATSSPK